jgi:hypothetical protein
MIVFKTHHSVADVYAQLLMLFNMQDDPSLQKLPRLSQSISTVQNVLLFLLLPLNVLWCSFLTVVCLPKECNALSNPYLAN